MIILPIEGLPGQPEAFPTEPGFPEITWHPFCPNLFQTGLADESLVTSGHFVSSCTQSTVAFLQLHPHFPRLPYTEINEGRLYCVTQPDYIANSFLFSIHSGLLAGPWPIRHPGCQDISSVSLVGQRAISTPSSMTRRDDCGLEQTPGLASLHKPSALSHPNMHTAVFVGGWLALGPLFSGLLGLPWLTENSPSMSHWAAGAPGIP